MANSVDPDQTAPIGAVCSGSTLFASILNSSVMLGKFFAADDFSRQPFQMHFFGALRVNSHIYCIVARRPDERCLSHCMYFYQVNMMLHLLNGVDDVESTQKSIITP